MWANAPTSVRAVRAGRDFICIDFICIGISSASESRIPNYLTFIETEDSERDTWRGVGMGKAVLSASKPAVSRSGARPALGGVRMARGGG
jgi:hypothetical protein